MTKSFIVMMKRNDPDYDNYEWTVCGCGKVHKTKRAAMKDADKHGKSTTRTVGVFELVASSEPAPRVWK